MSIYWFAALVLAMAIAGTWLFLRGLEREERRRAERARAGHLAELLAPMAAAWTEWQERLIESITPALQEMAKAMADMAPQVEEAGRQLAVTLRADTTMFPDVGHGPCSDCQPDPPGRLTRAWRWIADHFTNRGSTRD